MSIRVHESVSLFVCGVLDVQTVAVASVAMGMSCVVSSHVMAMPRPTSLAPCFLITGKPPVMDLEVLDKLH